jgi:oligopeptide transport system substrate-binding protein
LPKVLLLASAVLSAATLGGCVAHRTGAPSTGSSILRQPLQVEPTTLDPVMTDAGDTLDMLGNVYEGLVNVDEQTRVVPGVAERWETSADGKTLTFHLNPKATFHAPYARQVTAADVKYSLERTLWPETKSPVWPNVLVDVAGAKEVAAGKTKDLAGAQVIDEHTFAITLTHPCGYYPMELSGPFIVCKEALAKTGGKIVLQSAIGTGPYAIADFRPNQKAVLKANPDYWGRRPRLDSIERPVVLDQETCHAQFETGQLDLTQVSATDFDQDRNRADLKDAARLLPSARVGYVVMDSKVQKEFRDLRVRRAFAMAVDTNEIARVAFRGLYQPAKGFLAPGVIGFDPHMRVIPFDPAGAKTLLSRAGYPGGAGFPHLTLVYQQKIPATEAAVQMIRDDLKPNLGITIDLQAREAATFFADSDREALPFYYIAWSAVDPHDYLTLLMRTGGKYNTIGYSNPKFDGVVDAADAERDPAKRQALYAQANQIAEDDMAVLPIEYDPIPVLVRPYVRDLQTNLGGIMPHYRTRIAR